MKFETVVGIDAGANGAIVIWNAQQHEIIRMEKSLTGISHIMERIKTKPYPVCIIEKVQMRPSDLQVAGKAFGIQKMIKNYTELVASLHHYHIPYIEVYPATWQSYLRLSRKSFETKGERKNRYKAVAQKLVAKEYKVSLWNADALLIAEFGRRKMEFDYSWLLQNVVGIETPSIFSLRK